MHENMILSKNLKFEEIPDPKARHEKRLNL